MTFKTVEAILSADVAASGTVTLPYPTGSAQADFDPAGAHLASCAGGSYASDDSDFSLTFGGSTITFTNGASNPTLPKGDVLRVQMVEFSSTASLDAGGSGQEGDIDVFPPTANKGKGKFKAKDNTGDTTTTIEIAAQAAAQTYTIPDVGADVEFVMQKGVSATENETNKGTSAATSVKEYGDGLSHVTVLTATALAMGDTVTSAASKAVGDLIYTFPAGHILVEAVFVDIIVNPAGAENDAVVADVGVGTTIGVGAVDVLSGTAGFEDFMTGQAVTVDSSNVLTTVKESTGGGPMYISDTDDRTLHINAAAAWQNAASATIDYTGTVVLIWKYLGA